MNEKRTTKLYMPFFQNVGYTQQLAQKEVVGARDQFLLGARFSTILRTQTFAPKMESPCFVTQNNT